MKTYACPKQSSSENSKRESAIMVLQESVTKISRKDSLHRRESAISHGSRKASDRHSSCSSVRKVSCKIEEERHEARKEKHRRQKERAAFQSSSTQTFVCPKCSRVYASKIGLSSHQRACKDGPSNLPNNPRLRGMSYQVYLNEMWLKNKISAL